MSEIVNGYPPYHDKPHNDFLAEQICSGERPEIKCEEVPQSLLNLMNQCLEDEPKKRPSAEKLVSKLRQHRKDIENKKANLYKEVKAVENSAKTLPARLIYKIHENASYKSTCLSKSLNSGIKIIYSKVINLQ
ncbi:hypothetical protein C2G38_2112074 [Gigaspora rosea]|uniref:Serine-threonine/tyrosine-protein kinase catalytic domain-containing protein n=1 Tax=Gigaspora rosea TaxID=44941 RepID=A0A397UCQ3_9GLOM|nr:hypothetical protein C2G38_2112074 [Gigaspora rosea]